MHHANDDTGLEDDLVAGQFALEVLLATLLAIERDVVLRDSLGGRVAIAIDPSGPYAIIDAGRLVATAMPGQLLPDVERVVTLRDLTTIVPKIRASFPAAMRTARDDAHRAIDAITDGEGTTAAEFRRLDRWAPALAVQAYRNTVAITSLFDLTRDELASSRELRTYWDRVHLLGHLTLLATSAQPTTWLADMAHSFPWQAWTPSFPLVRERILRLAVRGGWAASRFGVAVVPRYLERLSLGRPLHSFDATLAVVAIAMASSSSDREVISHELFALLDSARTPARRELYGSLARSARIALESPDEALRQLDPRRGAVPTLEHVVASTDRDDDCAQLDADGYFAAILAMAALATAPAVELFPATSPGVSPRWKASRARTSLSRTRITREGN